MAVFKDDISNGLELNKISFFNDITDTVVPSDVIYTTSCILSSESLTEEFESVSVPCDCGDNCVFRCPCSGADAFINRKLVQEYSNSTGKPIIECSDLCNCNNHCPNRIVQQGISCSLQIFMTHQKGFGVRTLNFLPKLSFVCEYAGEIIDEQEAEIRIKAMRFDTANYIYVLREYNSEGNCTRTIIDPTFVGNIGRYINHSCSPNLIPVPVRSNSMIPRICFFTNCDVEPLQELTYDYGGQSEKFANSSKLTEDVKCARKCLCQSINCVQVLPFNGNLLH